MRWGIAVSFAAGLTFAAPVPKSIRPPEPLRGAWVSESVDIGTGAQRSRHLHLRCEGGLCALTEVGMDTTPDTPYSVDDSQTPAHVTLGRDLPGERASRAICRLDGDTLTWCQAASGDPRPSEFKGGLNGQVCVVFRRVKE